LAVLLGVIFVPSVAMPAGCGGAPAHSPEWKDPCSVVHTKKGSREGYVVEWACGSENEHERFCPDLDHHHPDLGPYITFDFAVVRGSGSSQLGARVMWGLYGRLQELHSFSRIAPPQCIGATLTVWVRDSREVDRAIEIVGAFLRDRDANDRIFIDLELAAAPAI
jgi:hypothetical protein